MMNASQSHTDEPFLPQNVDAEIAVLGSILIDPVAIAEVFDRGLRPEHFYIREHRRIYKAMMDLYEEGGPADFITVCEELTQRGELEKMGGTGFVGSFANNVPTSRNVLHYARIVMDKAELRATYGLHSHLAALSLVEPNPAVVQMQEDKLLGELREHFAGEAPQEDPLRPLSLEELLARPKPELLIDQVLLARGVSMFAGSGESGKSVLLADAAIHVVLGEPWLGHRVKQGGVMIVAGEGGTAFAWRVKAALEQRGLTAADVPGLTIIPHALQVLEASQRARVVAYAKQLPQPPVWVIVETLSQTAAGADQNANDEMSAYVRACRDLGDALGAHVSFSHHALKNGESYRGASSLRDDSDTVLCFERSEDVSTVTCGKQRDGWEKFYPFTFTAEMIAPSDSGGLFYGVFRSLGTGLAAVPKPNLTPKRTFALNALRASPDGLPFLKWLDVSGLQKSAFADAVGAFIRAGLVDLDATGIYTAVLAGPVGPVRSGLDAPDYGRVGPVRSGVSIDTGRPDHAPDRSHWRTAGSGGSMIPLEADAIDWEETPAQYVARQLDRIERTFTTAG